MPNLPESLLSFAHGHTDTKAHMWPVDSHNIFTPNGHKKEKRMFEPSSEQSAIFAHIGAAQSNLIIPSCPGSGKTTTSMLAMSHVPKASGFIPTSILYLVFAKANAEEATARAPRGVTVSTFHSLGLRAFKAVHGNVKVDSRKVPKLVWNTLSRDDNEIQNVIRLVGLLKSGLNADDAQALALCDSHNLDVSQKNRSVALRVLEKSDADLSSLDFDDMLRLPVLLSLSFAPWDWVFVDEAQDTNEVQVEILARLGRKELYGMTMSSTINTTRYVIVGDPHQSIYGFRGAQTSAMDVLKERFQCTTLPLSVSYRCPQAVVREAQRILSLSL